MRENKSMASDKLGISVVICTYNGSSRLLPTLNSVIQQDLSNTLFELIVVDNASQDNTVEFCERVLSGALVAFPWKIVSEQKPGLNYARLKGLREAHFDVVLFCDDDNTLAQEYLRVAFNLLEKHAQIGALGGCGIAAFEGPKPAWFEMYSHTFAVGPQSDQDGKLKEIPAELYGAGTFFRKAPLLKFFDRGFNAVMTDRKGKTLTSGGDVEWCYLVQLAGYELWYDHRLTFLHAMPDGRMQWSYYLRLKEGIASGSGSLLPYICLLKNRHMGAMAFALEWGTRTVKLMLANGKNRLRLWFKSKPLKPEMELARVILQAKMFSYISSGTKAWQHFQHLKTML